MKYIGFLDNLFKDMGDEIEWLYSIDLCQDIFDLKFKEEKYEIEKLFCEGYINFCCLLMDEMNISKYDLSIVVIFDFFQICEEIFKFIL